MVAVIEGPFGMLAAPIAGLTMMYSMVRKVVGPAMISCRQVVPKRSNWK
jgi:hypothetical protein